MDLQTARPGAARRGVAGEGCHPEKLPDGPRAQGQEKQKPGRAQDALTGRADKELAGKWSAVWDGGCRRPVPGPASRRTPALAGLGATVRSLSICRPNAFLHAIEAGRSRFAAKVSLVPKLYHD